MAWKQSLILMLSALALTSAGVSKSFDVLLRQVGISMKTDGQRMNTTLVHQTVRRLQMLPAACKEACPGAPALLEAMMPMMSEMDQNASPKPEDVMKMMDSLMTIMCEHTEALQCVETNEEKCDMKGEDSHDSGEPPPPEGHDGDDHGGDDMDPMVMAECFCGHCPNLKDGFMGMMTALMSGGEAAPPSEEEMMKMACPMIEGLKCANDAPPCKPVVAQMSMEPGKLTEMETKCKAAGISTGTPATPAPAPAPAPSDAHSADSTTSLKVSAGIATAVAGITFAFHA